MKWVLLGILYVISVVLVASDVLRSHMMVGRVLVMMRCQMLVIVSFGNVMLLLLLDDNSMMVNGSVLF